MIGYLVGLVSLAAIALAGRHLSRSWAAPAVLLPTGWFAYAGMALLIIPEPQQVVPGLLWIVVSCVAFQAGSVLATTWPMPGDESPATMPSAGHFPGLGGIVLILGGASVGALILESRTLGFSPGDLVSVPMLARMAARSRSVFTFGDAEQGGAMRLLLALSYTGTLFAGMAFRVAATWRQRLAALLPLVTILLLGAMHGTRMGILFGGNFWVAAFVATALVGTRDRPRVATRLFMVTGGLAAVLLAALSTAVQFLRYYVGNEKTAALIIADPFGFLPAFSQWFQSNGVRTSDLTGGFYMFERLGRALGSTYPAVPVTDLGFTSSNVYTVFRAMIEDFGTLGSLVLTVAIGCLGSHAFRAVLAGRERWIAVLALTYAFVFTSPALSPFSYSGPLMGAVLFMAYVAMIPRMPARVMHMARA